MNRSEVYASDSITGLNIRLGWAGLDILVDHVDQIQLMITGDEADVNDIRLTVTDGILKLEQPTYGVNARINSARWMEIILRIPKQWKGSLEASTVSGKACVRGITGTDMKISSVSGHLLINDIECISMVLRNVSGAINGGRLYGESTGIKSVSGGIILNGIAFRRYTLHQVSGEVMLDMTAPFDRIDGSTVSGNVRVMMPMEKVDARLKTVSGRIRTSGVFLTDDAPKVNMTAVSANLELIRSISGDST